jgi:hypothetical protein
MASTLWDFLQLLLSLSLPVNLLYGAVSCGRKFIPYAGQADSLVKDSDLDHPVPTQMTWQNINET